jgi:hypothetical protein
VLRELCAISIRTAFKPQQFAVCTRKRPNTGFQPDVLRSCQFLTVGSSDNAFPAYQTRASLPHAAEIQAVGRQAITHHTYRKQFAMRLQQSLRKTLLHARSRHERLQTTIYQALKQIDNQAAVLSVSAALASKDLVKHLWEALPSEAAAYRYNSPQQLTSEGRWCIVDYLDERVTFHLGWDVLAFSTTVRAAWDMWPSFATLNTAPIYESYYFQPPAERQAVRRQ